MSEPLPPHMVQPPQPAAAGAVETLSELLCCYICADRLRDACLCPHCSKMGCYSCIKRWVTSNRANCPHCRAPLTESSLVRVPLFDELRHELEQLPTNPLEGNSHLRDRLCSQHREKVSVFCETCRLCICHECVLWDNSPHKHHVFIKLEVLLQKQSKICEIQLRRLHEHMKRVLSQVQSVERKMEAVKGGKLKVQREMKETSDKMSGRLEGQYEAKQHKLGEARQKLKGQAMQLTRATRDLENKIQTGSIACLLSERGDLREDVLLKLTELQSMEIEPIPSIGELFNEMVPSYTTSVFKVHPYSQLRQLGDEVYSKPLHMCGTVWKLKIYPNGHREDTGLYLSAFLELTEGYEKTVKYQYCVEMLYNCSNKHPSRNYKKEYMSDFADGESWGYRKFYELAKLEADGFLRDDTLVLRFSVRALTNHQKCRDLATHVRRLEHKVESLQKELRATRDGSSSSSSSTSAINSSSNPTRNEEAPGNYHSSPSRSRSGRHQHSNSEPISPSPRDGSPRGGRQREGGSSRCEEVRREQERRRSEEKRYDQERRREGARRRGERERYQDHHLQVAMSQQHPSRGHSQHSHSVKGGYHSQQRANESRMVSLDPPPPQFRSRRRDSGEGLREHRRRSADPALLQHHFENPISPPMFRHSLAPPTAPPTLQGSPQEHHLHFRRDSVGSATDDAHYGEEFGSQGSLLASPARHAHSGDRAPRFEDGSGDEGGCSQPHPWGEPLSHTDIQISIQDFGVPHPRPHHPTQLHPYHAQSQEQFIDEDEITGAGRVVPPDPLLGRAHSQLYEESHAHHGFKSDMPSYTSALSQPVYSRRRLQSSVPDLSMLTITASNLAHTQALSQSVMDMPRHRDHTPGLRPHHHEAPPRSSGSSRQGYHLHRMSSDPHLNSESVVHHPGLRRTMLARLREEPEYSPAVHRHRERGGAVGGASGSGRKGYRETRNRRKSPTPQSHTQQPTTNESNQPFEPAPTQRVSSGSSNSNPELTPTNPQPSTDTPTAVSMTTGTLSVAGKSSSNTSLSNLNLI